MKNGKAPRNTEREIDGRVFSGHALDQMQNRGVMPSVVKQAIEAGVATPGNKPNTKVFTDEQTHIRVVVNSQTGKIITVIRGGK